MGAAAMRKEQPAISMATIVHSAKWSVGLPNGANASSGIVQADAAPAMPAAWRHKSRRVMECRPMPARPRSIAIEFHKAASTISGQAISRGSGTFP